MQRSGKCGFVLVFVFFIVIGFSFLFLFFFHLFVFPEKQKLSQVSEKFQSKYGNILHIMPCSLSPMFFHLNHVIMLCPDFMQSFFRSK